MALLEVCKVAFEKEKSSDETKQVPNLPTLFNALCLLLKYEFPLEGEDEEEQLEYAQQYELICTEIANTVSAIASYGIQEIKDQEASLEDKLVYGSETSPMQRLYTNGNRNLRGLAGSDMPETLVNVLASSAKQRDTIVAVIEAIAIPPSTSPMLRSSPRWVF